MMRAGKKPKNRPFLSLFIIISMLASTASLIYVGAKIVKVAWYGLELHKTECTVITIDIGSEVGCECSRLLDEDDPRGPSTSCYSSYPCLVVWVSYPVKRSSGKNETTTGLLFISEEEVLRNKECVIEICNEDSNQNRNFVDEFISDHQLSVGALISCYIGSDRNLALMQTQYERGTAIAVVVNGLLWPSLVLVVSFVLFVLISKNVDL